MVSKKGQRYKVWPVEKLNIFSAGIKPQKNMKLGQGDMSRHLSGIFGSSMMSFKPMQDSFDMADGDDYRCHFWGARFPRGHFLQRPDNQHNQRHN